MLGMLKQASTHPCCAGTRREHVDKDRARKLLVDERSVRLQVPSVCEASDGRVGVKGCGCDTQAWDDLLSVQ